MGKPNKHKKEFTVITEYSTGKVKCENLTTMQLSKLITFYNNSGNVIKKITIFKTITA